ncbi:transglutaminase domain-containing protein [Dokdonia sp.]|uniref:DUF3857 domain-containing protein n=1 Tax=Dokdonia sp. TaxID=2024995 RepID=UPI003267484A
MIKFLLTIISIVFLGEYVNAQNYKFGKVSQEELAEELHRLDPEAGAAVLYRKTNTSFKYNQNSSSFQAIIKVHERVKIYSKENGGEVATIQLPLYKGYGASDDKIINLKGSTYTLEDGGINEVKLTSNGIFLEEYTDYLDIKKFTMPNITDGAVIEYKYTIITPYIGNLSPYHFQETIPVDKVEMNFWAPEYMIFKIHNKGWYSFDIKREKRRDKIKLKYKVESSRLVGGSRNRIEEIELESNGYEVVLSDVPALKKEDFTSNIENYRSGIEFELNYTKFPNSPINTYSTSWDAVAKDINDSKKFGDQLSESKFFKKVLANVVDDSSSKEEKIVQIFEFVRSNIIWNGQKGIYASKGVRKAFDEKNGNSADINLLLVGLLREAGIDSNPVLISSKSNGIPLFPTRNGFDFVVAAVGGDGNPLLLDASHKLSAPQILNTELINWNGRMIRANGTSSAVNLNAPKIAVHNSFVSASIDADLVLKGNSKNRFTGHYGMEAREAYVGLNKEEQLSKIEQKNKSWEIEKASFKEMENIYKPLVLEYDFISESTVEEIGGKLYISPLLNMIPNQNYFKSENRLYPIDFEFAKEDKYNITIKIPEGYKVESLPEKLAINLKGGMGTFRFDISESNGVITVVEQKSINRSRFGAETYKDLQQYFKMITKKENEKIVLIKL